MSTKSRTQSRTRCVKKPQKYLTFDQAREFLRANVNPFLLTRKAYWEWHDRVKPSFLPKRPDKVYKDFSWNEFLGTTNSFEKTLERNRGKVRRVYRPYWEAVRWAQKFCNEEGIDSQRGWREYCAGGGVLPDDIPVWPSHEYENFSWVVWTGKDVRGHLEAYKNSVMVVGLHNVVGSEANCVVIKVWKGGVSELREGDDSGIAGRLYQAWEVEENTLAMLEAGLNRYGHRRDIGYIVPNLNQLLWYLNMEVQLKIVKI